VADAKTNPDGVSKSTVYPAETDELIGEQVSKAWEAAKVVPDI
jgi:hypothetical protein